MKVLRSRGCDQASKATLEVLRARGFFVNLQKTILSPTECLKFLGVLADLREGVVSIPPYTRKSYRKNWEQLVVRSHITLCKEACILCHLRFLACMLFRIA